MPDMAWLGYTVNCTGIQARDFFLTGTLHSRHAIDLAAWGWLIGRFIEPDAGFSFVHGPHAGASGRYLRRASGRRCGVAVQVGVEAGRAVR